MRIVRIFDGTNADDEIDYFTRRFSRSVSLIVTLHFVLYCVAKPSR